MTKAETTELLKEIRERFDYCVTSWRDIREEAKKDMKYVSGDPWDDKEKKEREGKRPALVLDELQQHINQTVNEMKANKLAIKIHPAGGGAKPEHAQLRQARIRQIEYESKAQSAYLTAYENAIERSYGYFGMGLEYCDECSDDQKIRVRRFPNPDAIYIDPDTKEADCSDMQYALVLDLIPRKEFAKKYPNAETKDFSAEHLEIAKGWGTEKHVQIAEYWRIETESLPDDVGRKKVKRTVRQYITNGLEILEETDWIGKWIPIFPVYGKEMYVDSGDGAKRMLLSRVRLARDPYMLYCAVRTAELEQINITPKVPYLGYEGQFDTLTDWANINKVPSGYAEVKAKTEATGEAILERPTRQPYEPSIAPLEMAAESAKRAIQSAFGSYNASVGKEDTHARSGVAIKSLQQQTSLGTYHFVDNYITTLEHAGRSMNDLLDKIEATPRDVSIMKPDDTPETIRINEPVVGEDGVARTQTYGQGNFSVVVSVGPSYQTERDEASAFVDSISQIPGVFPRIGDLLVRLKNFGSIGDEIAKRLVPPEFAGEQDPAQLAQQLGQAQQQMQQMGQQMQMLVQERESKKLELESKEKIAAIGAEVDKLKIEADSAKSLAQLESNEALELLRQDFERLESSIEQLRSVEDERAAVPSRS